MADIPQKKEQEKKVSFKTEGDRVQIEFQVEDLISRLLGPSRAAAHCGGCNGCGGCSHITDIAR